MTIATTTHPFDFTAEWERRPLRLELAARLERGDMSAMPEAEAEEAISEATYDRAAEMLRAAGITGIHAVDALNTFLCFCTGMSELDTQLGYIKGYHERPAGAQDDDGITLADLDETLSRLDGDLGELRAATARLRS